MGSKSSKTADTVADDAPQAPNDTLTPSEEEQAMTMLHDNIFTSLTDEDNDWNMFLDLLKSSLSAVPDRHVPAVLSLRVPSPLKSHKWFGDSTLLVYVIRLRAPAHVVQHLIEFGADAMETSPSPLYVACCRLPPDVDVLRVLVAAGASARVEEGEEEAPLITACSSGAGVESVRLLLVEAGGQVNLAVPGSCRTPLLAACSRFPAQADVLQLLLQYGADVKAMDYSGATALMLACKTGSELSAIQVLLDAGSPVLATDDRRKTALMYACESNASPDVVRALLDAGSAKTINISDGSWTPLVLACRHGAGLETVQLLLDAGASTIEMEKSSETMSAMMAALSYQPPIEVVRALVDACEDINHLDRHGGNVLMYARSEVLQLLIDAGASLGAVSKRLNQVTNALHAAVLAKVDDDTLRLLINTTMEQGHGDNVGRAMVLLIRASRSNTLVEVRGVLERDPKEAYLGRLERLLECGADPNLAVAGEEPPLHVAAALGSERAVRALLQAGAVPCLFQGRWPSHHAGTDAIRELLRPLEAI